MPDVGKNYPDEKEISPIDRCLLVSASYPYNPKHHQKITAG